MDMPMDLREIKEESSVFYSLDNISSPWNPLVKNVVTAAAAEKEEEEEEEENDRKYFTLGTPPPLSPIGAYPTVFSQSPQSPSPPPPQPQPSITPPQPIVLEDIISSTLSSLQHAYNGLNFIKNHYTSRISQENSYFIYKMYLQQQEMSYNVKSVENKVDQCNRNFASHVTDLRDTISTVLNCQYEMQQQLQENKSDEHQRKSLDVRSDYDGYRYALTNYNLNKIGRFIGANGLYLKSIEDMYHIKVQIPAAHLRDEENIPIYIYPSYPDSSDSSTFHAIVNRIKNSLSKRDDKFIF